MLFRFSIEMKFWISGFLYLFGFLAISRQQKELWEICWCQNDILHFFVFWPYLSNEKSYCRSTGVKTTQYSRAFQIFQKMEFMDFMITGFLYIFGFLAISRQWKELLLIRWSQNDWIFDNWFFWIFLFFFYFSSSYSGNEKSYRRSARGFQMFKKKLLRAYNQKSKPGGALNFKYCILYQM